MKIQGGQLIFGAAVGLCLLAGARAFLGGGPELPGRLASGLQGAAFAAETPDLVPQTFAPWAPPRAQSAGREWIFEVFTPPIVYFDPETGEFTVEPPLPPEPAPVFGLDLIAVERVPYRLQYVGYHGEPGRYWVELHDLEDDAYYRGRTGDRFEDGEFSLLRFTVENRRVRPEDRPWATPYLETFVEALVEDGRLGQTVTIGPEPRYLPEPIAIVATLDGANVRRFADESLQTPEGRFVLESVDLASQTVTVAKYTRTGTFLERQTLSAQPGAADPAP